MLFLCSATSGCGKVSYNIKMMPWSSASSECGEVAARRKSYGSTMCLTFIETKLQSKISRKKLMATTWNWSRRLIVWCKGNCSSLICNKPNQTRNLVGLVTMPYYSMISQKPPLSGPTRRRYLLRIYSILRIIGKATLLSPLWANRICSLWSQYYCPL